MSSEPIWATGGSPTETIERKKHEGRLSGVFHKVPCWGPSCESRHMTRSFVAPSLRARASSAMPMTLWFWPRDDGFMKHSNSARLSWRARFAPFRSWAWACHLPSLRPCGSSINTVEASLLLASVWTSAERKYRWGSRWNTWASRANGYSGRTMNSWSLKWPTPYAAYCQTLAGLESKFVNYTSEWFDSGCGPRCGRKIYWGIVAAYCYWGGCRGLPPSE